ncbi:hypothetical protein EGJ51_17940 [Pseudomonas fulva]|uniref:Uncharacterized protein n=1 Tax=Pseudomonas parafulva TaxID=157782 RepID=A0AAJ0PEV9_9PSED|nr:MULTISPECIES: hypothetical protein [Pseudomonas]KTT16920.1 hypothetical protein NS96R_14330 [Pseudomonas parafulva]MBA1218185.1 hypothetical protein [Pseudomonas fulva]RRW59521.1 hypothetical protein EGJ51_17940 [Pseudomonas fulva]
MSLAAAVYLNAVLCADATRENCDPPEFMYAPQESAPLAVRAATCEQLAQVMNLVQLDEAVYYVCSPSKGVTSERA